MTTDEIAQAIRHLPKKSKPIIIGIEGFGGSGKTTLANQLAQILGDAYVVNIDDFIVKEKITEPSWDKGGFDRDRLEQQVLLPASKQELIQYQELIWETNQLSAPKIVPQVQCLIIEGISCYHPNIEQYYDFKIWVDTPMDIAKARGKARDAGNENVDKWNMWAENDLDYQKKYHPEQRADSIIVND